MRNYTQEEITKLLNNIEVFCTHKYPQDPYAAKSGIYIGMVKAMMNGDIEDHFIEGIISGKHYGIEKGESNE